MRIRKLSIVALVLCLGLVLGACNISFGGVNIGVGAERGSGNVVEQVTPIDEGEGFALVVQDFQFMGNFRFSPLIVIDENLEHGEIIIATDDNFVERIDVSQRGERIVIRGDRGLRMTPTEMTIYVGVPIIDLDVGGAWDVTLECNRVTEFRADLSGASSGEFVLGALERLEIRLSGASDATFALGDGALEHVEARLSGASDITLQGYAYEAELHASGASDIRAFDLVAERAVVNASGASDIRITATESLDITASGASDVTFDGNPRISQSASGASSVRSR